MDLSVVIPVRDEADNIAPLVEEIRAALDGLVEYEILYIDDGSSDATVAEISRTGAKIPRVRLVRHAHNCGQSTAIRTGVRAAQAGWMALAGISGGAHAAGIGGGSCGCK